MNNDYPIGGSTLSLELESATKENARRRKEGRKEEKNRKTISGAARDRLRRRKARGGLGERREREREIIPVVCSSSPLMRCHEDLWTGRSLYANP